MSKGDFNLPAGRQARSIMNLRLARKQEKKASDLG
jgi:hypothetical protein